MMKAGKKIASGVLPICAKTGKLLLVKRGDHQSHPGDWGCFFGKFDEEIDKGPKDTAKREFVEESGYIGKYKISRTPLYITETNHKNSYTYVGIFDEEFIPYIQKWGEASDYGWFNLDEIPGNLVPKFKESVEEKRKTIQNIICFYFGKC